ncbi:LuxR family transcriptional regulator [Actinomadura fibrosa]|uniref:LuxR C-terminal-related transcriptional regulator n=1 Tax=Actinomadura fibrosa TaxID=111802 RepID=A0ABW2XSG5_9ACTN|nr:LuxR family transcriptional regulator [Actinomadura fibrosa]
MTGADGRDAALAEIRAVIDRARLGYGGAVAVRGGSGLVDNAARFAVDARVLRVRGTEAEADRPFASLPSIVGRHFDRIGALPDPQAAALRRALDPDPAGAGPGDRLLVGLALLSLLTGLARTRPLVLLVDDAQWLDEATARALAFAARRIGSARVALVLVTRPDAPPPPPARSFPPGWPAGDRRGEAAETADIAELRAAVEREQGSPRLAGTILLDGARRAGDAALASRLLGDAVLGAGYGADREALLATASTLEATSELAAAPETGGLRAEHARWVRALAAYYSGDLAAAVPALRAGLDAAGAAGEPPAIRVTMVFAAHAIGDDAAGERLAANLVEDCRRGTSAVLLPDARQMVVLSRLVQDDHVGARRLAAEALDAVEGTGGTHRAGYLTGLLAWLAAAEGDADRVAALARSIGWATTSGNRPVEGWVTAAWALLELGRGRPHAALERLRELAEGPASHVLPATLALPDHVEAAVRAGRPDLAAPAAARFAEYAERIGQPWARAVALRCRALLAADERAGSAYAEAVDAHPPDRRPFAWARTELLYGEWLRRRKRRGEARSHLRAAADVFERLDAVPWAERARGELEATGERAPRQDLGGASGRLTSQELQVVRLAAAGASNREIAARLSLSRHTVGYHLYKAFPKLGVSSRAQLQRLDLPGVRTTRERM